MVLSVFFLHFTINSSQIYCTRKLELIGMCMGYSFPYLKSTSRNSIRPKICGGFKPTSSVSIFDWRSMILKTDATDLRLFTTDGPRPKASTSANVVNVNTKNAFRKFGKLVPCCLLSVSEPYQRRKALQANKKNCEVPKAIPHTWPRTRLCRKGLFSS
jgi:hypothetical protein